MAGKSNSDILGIVSLVGFFVILSFIFVPDWSGRFLPETQPKPEGGEVQEMFEQEPKRVIAVQVAPKVKPVSTENPSQSQSDDSPGEFVMPYIEGVPESSQDYLAHILGRGGELLLSRSARLVPIAQVVLSGQELRVAPLPHGYKPFSMQARDVTREVRQVFGNVLPVGATRASLVWPESMQKALLGQLKKYPDLYGKSLKAVYRVSDAGLVVQVSPMRTEGGHDAVNYTLNIR